MFMAILESTRLRETRCYRVYFQSQFKNAYCTSAQGCLDGPEDAKAYGWSQQGGFMMVLCLIACVEIMCRCL